MKKIILCAITLIGFAGCATVSPYNQGCRAGINGWNQKQHPNDKQVNEYCGDLDRIHEALEKATRGSTGHGRG